MSLARLPSPRGSKNAVVEVGHFDADAYHVMEERDDRQIRERVVGGVLGSVFVYDFIVSGSRVTGISVEGAQHLAHHYKGIKHRIVATQEKKGEIFTFTTYPGENVPMQVHVSVVPELENEDDFYRVVVEVTDIKTGVSMQSERMEARTEKRKDGSIYERPNYAIIAQSKARRNGILMVIPQDVQEEFKAMCVKLGKNANLTGDAFAEKRERILAFATKNAIRVERGDLMQLADGQVNALREALEVGVDAFRRALEMVIGGGDDDGHDEDEEAKPKAQPKDAAKPAQVADARANARVMPAHDPETGELPEEEPAERRPAPREEPRQRAAGQVPPPRTARPQAGLAFGEEE